MALAGNPTTPSTGTLQNHTNHTRTPTTANYPASQVQAHSPINDHNHTFVYAINNMSIRRDMPPLPPTPPADSAPPTYAGENAKSGGDGKERPPASSQTTVAAKTGAQSFADVVSSPPGLRSPKSPSAGKYQQQEHASTRSTDLPNATSLSPAAAGKATPTVESPTAVSTKGDALDNNTSNISSSTTSDTAPNTDDAELEHEADHGHSQEQEDASNSSSDVEIYLNTHTLGLQDSAARMHMHVPTTGTGSASASGHGSSSDGSSRSNSGHSASSMSLQPPSHSASSHSSSNQPQGDPQGAGASTRIAVGLAASQRAPSYANSNSFGLGVTTNSNTSTSNLGDANALKTLSPLPLPLPLPTSSSRFQQHGNASTKLQASSALHQNPALRAPIHNTIPLPDVDECEHHLQQLRVHQQQLQMERLNAVAPTAGHAQGSVPSVHGDATIDLTGLAGGFGSATSGLYPPPGIPASQSQPLPSLRSPFDGPGAGFPTSASESALASHQGTQGQGHKTPNVYINGLPPHFPEDELFELASKFGTVKSVRTFTRHVRDSESGYGFVLFDRIEDAERCINELRKDRDLHPTFSKQVHKIPGTNFGQGLATTGSWESGHTSSRSSSAGDALDSNGTFKVKMESLQDPTSTNLYMEGLPLSIDEPTLAALVSPHRIISSRFFQTRLSNPPRIIAFVRLDTRVGAEEIIEKLHGRMVRGWNDAGSRISVRFADTSEQRELRRTERSAQDGDGSPARLTIAQAALLNLRGQDIRLAKPGSSLHAHARQLPASTTRGGLSTSISAPDFSSNAHMSSFPPVIGTTSSGLEVDYSLAPGRARSRSPYHGHQQDLGQYSQLPSAGSGNMHPATVSLFDSLRANAGPYMGSGVGGYSGLRGDADYVYGGPGHQQIGQGQHYHTHQHLPTSQSLGDLQQYGRPTPAYTRSGYTATEEYIMRAHAETAAFAQVQAQQQHQQTHAAAAERRRPAPLDLRRRVGDDVQDDSLAMANIAVGVRGYRAQASIGRVGQRLVSTPMTSSSTGSMASSPMMGMGTVSASTSEDNFHAPAANRAVGGVGARSVSGMLNTRLPREKPASAPASTTTYHSQQLPRLMPVSPLLPSISDQAQEANDAMLAYQQSAAHMHMRSTTLPQQRASSIRDQQRGGLAKGHYQHNSLSMPAQPLRTPQHASVAKMAGSGGVDGVSQDVIYEGDGHEEHQAQQGSGGGASGVGSNTADNNTANTHSSQAKTHYSSANFGEGDRHNSPTSPSPSLISPTLTYSSQTPSTLSPATPFFGSFSNNQAAGEGFETNANSKTGLPEQQQPQQRKTVVGIASGLSR